MKLKVCMYSPVQSRYIVVERGIADINNEVANLTEEVALVDVPLSAVTAVNVDI